MKRIFILLVLLVSPFSYAGDEITECLMFSVNEHQEIRELIIKRERIPENVINNYKIYIALTDLNDDGVNEVFEYIEGGGFCGNQSGCYINVVDIDGRKLSKYGFPTNWKFNPEGDFNYMCVTKGKSNGYLGLLKSNEWLYEFDGSAYRFSRRLKK